MGLVARNDFTLFTLSLYLLTYLLNRYSMLLAVEIVDVNLDILLLMHSYLDYEYRMTSHCTERRHCSLFASLNHLNVRYDRAVRSRLGR